MPGSLESYFDGRSSDFSRCLFSPLFSAENDGEFPFSSVRTVENAPFLMEYIVIFGGVSEAANADTDDKRIVSERNADNILTDFMPEPPR